MKVSKAVEVCLAYHQANSEKKHGHNLQVCALQIQ